MTLTQKILCDHAVGLKRPWVETGDTIRIRADWTIASELAWNGMNATYEKLGRPDLHDRERFYLALDHTVDPGTLANDTRTQRLVQLSRDFAKERRLPNFFDANETIMHTKFYRDLVQPGETVIGADSHTSSHGGVGAFAIGLGGADVCIAMVLGETWIQVPEAIQVVYDGRLPFGLTGKDVILETLGELGRNTVAMERSVEYVGSALAHFSTDFRFTVANMTAEFGGLNGIFPADEHTAELLAKRKSHRDAAAYFRADDDAEYASRHRFDLAKLAPKVAKPFSPDNVFDVTEVAGQAMQGMFVGACTTTEEEIILGALVLRAAMADGKEPAAVAGDHRIVVPGSRDMAEGLRRKGLLDIYESAGFRVGASGCSMCLGIASDKAAPGENWLTSQNRNFENRMGAGSLAWLASAVTVAASALDLKITDPRPLLAKIDEDEFRRLLDPAPARPAYEIREPAADVDETAAAVAVSAAKTSGPAKSGATIEGKVQTFGDHVDTDAMIPGEFCHLTKPDEIGKVAFHYVRPDFGERVARGETVLVAGEGWGSGSSREHAVWALKYAGVKAVIAKSYAFIHKRNLVNEAVPFFLIDDPAFFAAAKDGATIMIDPGTGVLNVGGREYRSTPPADIAARIQSAGGIVPSVQRHGKETFDVLTRGAPVG
ncbi:MAG: 3-isopropylmalate dehydratase [Gemmatimonadetes bacterium]|nr:3-isopropylmalate dehydratase [Gemmatimonadota bacterium]